MNIAIARLDSSRRDSVMRVWIRHYYATVRTSTRPLNGAAPNAGAAQRRNWQPVEVVHLNPDQHDATTNYEREVNQETQKGCVNLTIQATTELRQPPNSAMVKRPLRCAFFARLTQ